MRAIPQQLRRPDPLPQLLEFGAHRLQFQDCPADVRPGRAPVLANLLQQAELRVVFAEFAAVSTKLGPELGEDLVLGELGVGVIAGSDAVDDIEAVFEVLEDEQEGLGLGDEAVDFVFDDARVLDVLVEEGVFGEFEGLEGSEDAVGDEGLEGAAGAVAGGNAVEDAFRPARRGQDVVDAPPDVAVEFLEIVGGDAGCFDEAVEFEDEFVLRVELAEAYYLAEVSD